MDSEQAFYAVRKMLQSDVSLRLTESVYDDENFGNFVISFRRAGRPASIVLDRGELVICSDSGGRGDCKTVLSSVYETDGETVLAALVQSLQGYSNSTMT